MFNTKLLLFNFKLIILSTTIAIPAAFVIIHESVQAYESSLLSLGTTAQQLDQIILPTNEFISLTPTLASANLTSDSLGLQPSRIVDIPAPSYKQISLGIGTTPDAELVLEPIPRQPSVSQAPQPSPDSPETEVLVSEVIVQGIDADKELIGLASIFWEGTSLETRVYEAISTRPGRTSTRQQIQADINAIFITGLFTSVRAVPSDTPLGVRVTYIVQPNPVLRSVKLMGNRVMPQEKLDEIFDPQYGKILDLNQLQSGIQAIEQYYKDEGYVFGNVVGAPTVDQDGTVTLQVVEGQIEAVNVVYLNEDREPTKGKTRKSIIIRELVHTKPGGIFNQDRLKDDLRRVCALGPLQADVQECGLFYEVKVGLEPGQDPSKVVVNINVLERGSESFSVGLGYSTSRKTFGTGSYTDDNFSGLANKLTISLDMSESFFGFLLALGSPGSLVRHRSKDSLQEAGISALDAIDRENQKSALIAEAQTGLLNQNKLQLQESIQEFINLGFAFDNSDLFRLSESKYQEALKIADDENRHAEAALTLNNLGNLYTENKDYINALSAYNKALEKFQKLKSPALEIITWIRLADINREIGEPHKSIHKYHKALDIIRKYRNQTNPEFIFGKEILSLLSTEWHLNTQYLDKEIVLLSNLLELTIILDIASAYSSLGDYQQSSYIFNSLELKENIERVSSPEFRKQISKSIQNISNFESEYSAKGVAQILFNALKNRLKHLSLEQINLFSQRSIYLDLNEEELAIAYQNEIENIFGSKLRENSLGIISEIYKYVFTQHIETDDLESLELKNLFRSSIIRSLDLLGASTNRIITKEKRSGSFKENINSITEPIVSHLSASDDYEADELIAIKDFLDLTILSFSLIYPKSVSTKFSDKVVATDTIDITQNIINRDSLIRLTDTENFDSLKDNNNGIEFFKKFIYLIQGESYYALGEYQKAAEIYELYFQEPIDTFNIFTHNKRNINLEEINQSPTEGIANQTALLIGKSYAEQQNFEAVLKLANIYLKLGKAVKSKSYYKDALSTHLKSLKGQPNTSFYRTLSEIYFGIARADLLLGNFESSQKNIEFSISSNDKTNNKKSLYGLNSLTNLELQYGYGYLNRGHLSSLTIFSSYNIWSPHWSRNFKTRSCNPIIDYFSSSDYFTCKQKYYEFYISLLMKQHAKSPSSGFDILAFEQSEKARIDSDKIFQKSSEIKKISSGKNFLNRRKKLLQNPASLKSIEDLILDKNTLLIEYFLGEDKSYLWLVAKGEPLKTYELPPRSIIEEKARKFYKFLTEPVERERPKNMAAVGQELSHMILGPIADQLDKQRILIIADGFLQYIPFNTLPNPTTQQISSKDIGQGVYYPHLRPLIIDHEIVTLASATSLVAIRKDRLEELNPIKDIAIVVDPVLNHEDQRTNQIALGAGFNILTKLELRDLEPYHSKLSNAVGELSDLRSYFPGSQSKIFSGFDADLNTILDPNFGQYSIVHFATHSIFNSQAPQRSGIVLSGLSEQGQLQTGLLSPVYAFNNLDLAGTELVVLSGCRTGLSNRGVIREGLTGLTGGLLSAGADRVVASLWNVNDEATRELMRRFYRLMLDQRASMPPAQALRAAQISMWEDPQWHAPKFWAAFFIQGDWK